MKRTAFLSVFLFFCLCGGYAIADVTYQSEFGFTITLPPGWTIMSRSDVKDKPDITRAALAVAEKNNTIKNLPLELYNKLKEKLTGGEMEYYYRVEAPAFNISVYQDVGTIAQTKDDEQAACDSLSEELGKLSSKPVNLFECRFEEKGNAAALYLVADAYREDQKYVQYLVQKSPNKVLLFTGSCDRNEDFEKVKAEFDRIIKSLQIL
ncbi:MAG: hypothetical protein A4E65_02272 [Syntrophorhabdus sp. PtaU1.Bin153]|nr:MAG: hypothetical protein A4E65_02272 [Syntrophorhabdus sp. PtaU1.Bin153]